VARHLRLTARSAQESLVLVDATRPSNHRVAREASWWPGLCIRTSAGLRRGRPWRAVPYVTMEFVEGGSLADGIAGTPRRAAGADLVATLADAIRGGPRTAAGSCTATSSRTSPCSRPTAAQGHLFWAGPTPGGRSSLTLTGLPRSGRRAKGARAARASRGRSAGRGRVRPGGYPVRTCDGPARPSGRRPAENGAPGDLP